jgi:hypothetical protein
MKIYTADDECPKEEIEYTVTRRGTSIGPHAGMEDVSTHESFDDAQCSFNREPTGISSLGA